MVKIVMMVRQYVVGIYYMGKGRGGQAIFRRLTPIGVVVIVTVECRVNITCEGYGVYSEYYIRL